MYIKDMSGNIVRWDFYGGNLLGVKKNWSILNHRSKYYIF